MTISCLISSLSSRRNERLSLHPQRRDFTAFRDRKYNTGARNGTPVDGDLHPRGTRAVETHLRTSCGDRRRRVIIINFFSPFSLVQKCRSTAWKNRRLGATFPLRRRNLPFGSLSRKTFSYVRCMHVTSEQYYEYIGYCYIMLAV